MRAARPSASFAEASFLLSSWSRPRSSRNHGHQRRADQGPGPRFQTLDKDEARRNREVMLTPPSSALVKLAPLQPPLALILQTESHTPALIGSRASQETTISLRKDKRAALQKKRFGVTGAAGAPAGAPQGQPAFQAPSVGHRRGKRPTRRLWSKAFTPTTPTSSSPP